MFTEEDLKTKLAELRRLPAETEWVEFKEARNGFVENDLGKYFSGLSNEANLRRQPNAWLVLGVEDKLPHNIVGSCWHQGNRASLDELKQRVAIGTGGHSFTELPDRLILQNRGDFFDGSVEDYVLRERTPERYRNTFLAQAMVNLDMIDTMGMGIRRIFQQQRARYLPLPEYDLSDTDRVAMTIFGRQIDENYGRILMERKDLNIAEIVVLDRIQKKQVVDRDAARQLRSKRLVTGRYPKLYLAADVARATDTPADYTRHRAFDKQYYKDFVVEFLRQHKEAKPQDFQRLLMDKLSDLYSEAQRRAKIRNLLQEMAKMNVIENVGGRGNQAKWRLVCAENR